MLRAAGPQGALGAREPWCQSGAVLSRACFVLLLEKEKGNEVGGGEVKVGMGMGVVTFTSIGKSFPLKRESVGCSPPAQEGSDRARAVSLALVLPEGQSYCFEDLAGFLFLRQDSGSVHISIARLNLL